jgi:hypothetical protein
MTSASQPFSRIQAITDSRVAGIRALSLKAGITMLYLGYLYTIPALQVHQPHFLRKILAMITQIRRNSPETDELQLSIYAAASKGSSLRGP